MFRQDVKELRNVGLASLGGLLEYFDFQVYVFVAAALSAELFPPGNSVWKSQVQAFGVFALGYLVRPIAGIIIAHYADRIGRKKLFVFTVLLMSVPTFLMGLLPTYAVAGWMAPAALLLLRVLQGCAVGGELPGAAVFICEHATPRRLGIASGLFLGMVNCGLLLGALAAFLAKGLASLLGPEWASLAWRLPFIGGGLAGLLAAYLRRHLSESPMFEQIREEKQLSKQVPLAAVLRDHWRQCLFAVALVFSFSITPAIYFQWLPTYLIGVRHVSSETVFAANMCGVAAFVLAMPAWGSLRERLGWKLLLVLAAVLNVGVAAWFFAMLPGLEGSTFALAGGLVVAGALSSIPHSLIAGLICALFPTPIRQSGFAFPYSVGTAIISGLTPLAVAWLVRPFGLAVPVAVEIAGGVVALILAGLLRFLPLYLGNAEPSPEARPLPSRARA